jgi:hypothetical protein
MHYYQFGHILPLFAQTIPLRVVKTVKTIRIGFASGSSSKDIEKESTQTVCWLHCLQQ